MQSLAEKELLRGQVQTIYLDPPYGIDFKSNWQVSTRDRNVTDGRLQDVTRQPEQIRAYRDTWQWGVNSYLSYLRDRLIVARELLAESGSVFVQIGEDHQHVVRCLMDEVFGANNCGAVITYLSTSGIKGGAGDMGLPRSTNYLLWYVKNREAGFKWHAIFDPALKEMGKGGYDWIPFANGEYRGITARELRREAPLPEQGRIYYPDNITSQGGRSEDQTFLYQGRPFRPSQNAHWKPGNFPQGMERLGRAGRLHVAKNSLRYVRYSDDFAWTERNNVWTDTLTGQYTEDKIYVVQTAAKVIERCILMTTDPGDLVLDPTCGSGTTAYVCEQWARRWITIDTSRVAVMLTRTRLLSARFPYYLLADSPEGMKKEAEILGTPVPDAQASLDVHKGFVYERV